MLTETAETVLKRRYYLKGEDGECVENWPALCSRVALAVASQEPDKAKRKAYQEAFFSLIHDLDFLPNSPCLMNAGTGIGQLSACFVLPVDDSMEGIFTAVRNGALVHKTGGGTGYSFSRLRAKNTAVKSTQGIASGPLSFMEVFNTATETIKQGGKRRGANMAVLRVDHPDILEFIDAKEDLTKFTNFNFSVALTDEFMKKVEAGNEEALAIFNRIVDRAWRTGEPGVLFIDTANRDNPTPHLGDFESCNPCCTGDTLILTLEHGYKRIDSLVGRNIHVWNGAEWASTTPTQTGSNREVQRVYFSDGSDLSCTLYHGFYLADGSKVEAKDLQIGDALQKHSWPVINCGADVPRVEAYTAGFFSGDGSIHTATGNREIWLYGEKKLLLGEIDSIKSWECSGDRVCVKLPKGDKYNKWFVPGIDWSMQSRLDWLAGLIDSDGTLNDKGGSVSISSVNLYFLKQVKLMLNTLGQSGCVAVMKKACLKEMPDGKGGTALYQTQESHRLVIPASKVKSLREMGLATNRVDISIANPDRAACRFVRVTNIDRGGMIADKVYCFNEPLRHAGIFNGVMTAQCGEQWLLPYESCNLGSINLGNFVMENQTIDYGRLSNTVKVAMRFLDNVVDCNNFPIPEIAEMTQNTRKTGLGIMGLHDMLIQLRLPYDSEEGRRVASQVMQFVKETALSYSEGLVQEKGVFPAYIASADYAPRRNAALTSIQPTGTVSMIADCASGCEPYFSIVMVKNVMDGDRLLMVNKHFERIARDEGWYSDELMEEIARSGTAYGNTKVPPYWQEIFATAQDISPKAHILMQAALQVHVDASISKTINLPNSATKEDVSESYMMAWRLGCKGLTVYRDGCRDNQVLNVGIDQAKPGAEVTVSLQAGLHKASLPDVLSAKRYRLKDANQETMYLIVCFDENERPMEVFAKFPFDNQHNLKDKSTMWTTTCRMVSLALRCSIPMEEIIKQLDRSSGHMLDLPAQLGKLLKSFMATTQRGYAAPCPECEGGMLVFKEGCESCEVCGYSKCS